MKLLRGGLVSFLILCLCEGLLRLFPSPQLSPLPTIELHAKLHAYHVLREEDRCHIDEMLTRGADSTQQVMSPQEFPCVPIQKRIVLLGGSTIQGYGVSPHENLQAHLTSLTQPTYDVINLGVAGYTSSQIVDMLPEVWAIQPDILVVYTGHNDVIFYPEIQSIFEEQYNTLVLWKQFRKIRIFQWLEKTLITKESQDLTFDQRLQSVYTQSIFLPTTPEDIIQTHQKAIFHESNILELLQFNLGTILQEAQNRGVFVVVVSPMHRLDAPILGGLYATSMTLQDIQNFEACTQIIHHPPPIDNARWAQCLSLNSTYGPLRYQYGKMFLHQRQITQAIEQWTYARRHTPAIHQGHFPQRWISPIQKIVEENSMVWIDLFGSWHDPEKFALSQAYFVDSIHLSSLGHKQLAQQIWTEIEKHDAQ